MKAINLNQVKKSFKKGFIQKTFPVLTGVDLTVEAGSIFGFLGPNGAGKSTTIKLLLGLIHSDSGSVEILEKNPQLAISRKNVGYMPEHPYFYEHLSPIELLKFYGGLFKIPKTILMSRIHSLLEKVDLLESKNKPIRTFSKGMLQKVGLIQAMINDPDLLILDEPLSGLDPVGRKEFRELIHSFSKNGKTVFFSSHIIHDVETICNEVAFIKNGKIKSQGKLSDLLIDKNRVSEILFNINNALPTELRQAEKRGEYYLIHSTDVKHQNELIRTIQKNEGVIIAVNQTKQGLEELFLRDYEK